MFCKEAWGNCYVFAERRYCQFLCSSEKRCWRYAIWSLFPECKQLSTKPSTDTNDFFSCAVWTFPNNSNGQFFKPMCLIDCFRESQTHDWKPWSPNDFHKWALLYFAFPVARWTSKTMSMTAPGCPGMSPPPQKPTQLNCLTIQKRWCYHGLPIKTNQRKYAKCVA